jgi:23S rRNA (uracil1939-C5)-methyltransferase
MHLNRSTAEAIKTAKAVDALAAVGIDAPVTFHTSKKQSGYRNRGQFVVTKEKGRVVLGAYAPRSHDVVSMSGCRVLRLPMARLATRIAELMTARQIPVYPEQSGIRYITLRTAANGASLVDLVVGGSDAKYLPSLARQVLAMRPIIGVSYSENSDPGNAMRVGPSTRLCGTDSVIEWIGEIGLRLTAAAFSQLNGEVAASMYAEAAEGIPNRIDVIWDLFAGAGGLGLTAAKGRPDVRLFAADVVDASLPLAVENAQRSGISMTYETLDLSRDFPVHWPKPDVVLLNPPRRGLSGQLKDWVIVSAPAVVIYMSCNPRTFGRDLRTFTDAGYVVGGVSAYDMLPGTAHVEVIARLTLKHNAAGLQ